MKLEEFENWARERADEGYGPGITREDALDAHLAEALITIAELTQMLTAATDVAIQRGRRIDAVQAVLDAVPEWNAPTENIEVTFFAHDIREALDGG